MDKTNEVITTLQNMSYEEKLDVYREVYFLGTFSSDTVNDKVILISLISLLYIKMKQKNPKVTPLQIIMKITGQEADGTIYYKMLETLSIMVEEFSWQCKTASPYGLKTSKEIINKIKEILSVWIPF